MNTWIFNDKERVGQYVADQVRQKSSWGGYNAIGVERDGKLIAGMVVNNFNGANATVHVALSGPMPRDFLPVCFEYLFVQANLKRVTGLVPSSNKKALKFDEHIGFVREWDMKDGHPDGVMHVLVMFKENCRWIGAGKHEHQKLAA